MGVRVCVSVCVHTFFDINEERTYHAIHSLYGTPGCNRVATMSAIAFQGLRWQATSIGCYGHSYDQNDLCEGVLFCLHQQTSK